MTKYSHDKYYTNDDLAKYCVNTTFDTLGDEWNRIIEPSAGGGSFLNYLPDHTISYDILPEDDRILQADYLEVDLPYMEKSLVIGNPPFGRANKLSVKFVIKSLLHSDFISFIQPISQLDQNRTMKNTELVFSEDIGKIKYSGRNVHCCLNIYKKSSKKKDDYSIDGIYSRHIFRSGKYQHKDELLDFTWDFRVSAWGKIKLLGDGEFCDNEVVFRVDDESKREWLGSKLKECDFNEILKFVTSPNLPAWRLNKWLLEQYKDSEEYGEFF